MQLLEQLLTCNTSHGLRLSLTPPLVTFILQSTYGDNQYFGYDGSEYSQYDFRNKTKDPISDFIELGPVTSTCRRRVWQSAIGVTKAVADATVNATVPQPPALNEAAHVTRTNQWAIAKPTPEVYNGARLIFILIYEWCEPSNETSNVVLLEEPNRSEHSSCGYQVSALFGRGSEKKWDIETTRPKSSITSNSYGSSKAVPGRFTEITAGAGSSTSHRSGVLSKLQSIWCRQHRTVAKQKHHTRINLSQNRRVIPSVATLFYILCSLTIFTEAYHVNTKSVIPRQIGPESRDSSWTAANEGKSERRARTPNYLFRLHDRHMRQWWDFDQFEADHLKHPIQTASGLVEDKWKTWNDARLGTITAVRHHRHIGKCITST